VNILIPEIPMVERVIRSATMYLFVLIAFRLAGPRQFGQMTALDLVVLLVISNVVQNALIGNDNSPGGELLGATVILLSNALVAWLIFRHKRVERLIEQTRTGLVRHGRILRENLRRDRLSSRSSGRRSGERGSSASGRCVTSSWKRTATLA